MKRKRNEAMPKSFLILAALASKGRISSWETCMFIERCLPNLRSVAVDPPTTTALALPSATSSGSINSQSAHYSSQLCFEGRGFPLYKPGPRRNSPPHEHEKEGVSIGDVGRVNSDGVFDFFFNIYRPADDPINATGTPENFRSLTPRYDSADVTLMDWCADDYVSTQSSVERIDLGPSESELQKFAFECSGHQGALLAIPLGSLVQKLDSLEDMLQYARQNAESWYKYVNEVRGRRLANGSLYLITGWEKARAWGMANYRQHTTQRPFRLSFEPTTGDNMGVVRPKYRWTASGPARTRTSGFIPTEDAPLNQTVFLHGFSISLGDSIWGKLFKDVGICQIVDSNAGQHNGGYVPFGSPGQSSFTWAGLFGGYGSTVPGGKQCAAENDRLRQQAVTISELSPTKELFHPSRIINDYIHRKFPDAAVVMTHDDDWRDILKINRVRSEQEAIALSPRIPSRESS
ncbi:hypothetical protein FB45DRAFT_560 [Roridomyces roridus]|uniref:Uncharacterized protein n=1 Tax=Roridomyces roridus TaxID=1738132 RepID=A0AAD7CID2_9AGAR|nr:hypothetical protein FB45DRAFT_560 [Roridomyces roridus]